MKTKKNIKSGFSLVELLVVVAIFTAMFAGIVVSLSTGQNSWFNTAIQIDLEEDLRLVLQKVYKELRESGSNSVGAMQVVINDNTGFNGSDVLDFSIPVICQAGVGVIDANGDVANWGATFNWGCTDQSCMDTDNDCSTREYSAVRYQINANNQLERRVLDTVGNTLKTDVFADNITNFQAVLSGDQNMVSLTITLLANTLNNRTITLTDSLDVYLRNRG